MVLDYFKRFFKKQKPIKMDCKNRAILTRVCAYYIGNGAEFYNHNFGLEVEDRYFYLEDNIIYFGYDEEAFEFEGNFKQQPIPALIQRWYDV